MLHPRSSNLNQVIILLAPSSLLYLFRTIRISDRVIEMGGALVSKKKRAGTELITWRLTTRDDVQSYPAASPKIEEQGTSLLQESARVRECQEGSASIFSFVRHPSADEQQNKSARRVTFQRLHGVRSFTILRLEASLLLTLPSLLFSVCNQWLRTL